MAELHSGSEWQMISRSPWMAGERAGVWVENPEEPGILFHQYFRTHNVTYVSPDRALSCPRDQPSVFR
jgi:hypothetical protein